MQEIDGPLRGARELLGERVEDMRDDEIRRELQEALGDAAGPIFRIGEVVVLKRYKYEIVEVPMIEPTTSERGILLKPVGPTESLLSKSARKQARKKRKRRRR